jgi:hypothetical protein
MKQARSKQEEKTRKRDALFFAPAAEQAPSSPRFVFRAQR